MLQLKCKYKMLAIMIATSWTKILRFSPSWYLRKNIKWAHFNFHVTSNRIYYSEIDSKFKSQTSDL